MKPLHIVTGASSGVGRALATLLSERGHTVLAIARREKELIDLQNQQQQKNQHQCSTLLPSETLQHPGRIHILSADLSVESDRGRVVDWIIANGYKYKISTLTHCAAITSKGYLKDVTLEAYRQVMSINVEAPLFLTRALLPHFCREGGGARVLHLSSGAAHRPLAYNGLYCISKASLLMCYRMWNADVQSISAVKGKEVEKGISFLVGSAMPGVVDGPMQDAAREGEYPGVELYRGYKDKGLLIQPGKVAEFLCWLLFDTTNEEFTSQDWNIFDTSHHTQWLIGELNGHS